VKFLSREKRNISATILPYVYILWCVFHRGCVVLRQFPRGAQPAGLGGSFFLPFHSFSLELAPEREARLANRLFFHIAPR
jgi:hypothetical protein